MELRQVFPGQGKSADWCFSFKVSMGLVTVVAMEPSWQFDGSAKDDLQKLCIAGLPLGSDTMASENPTGASLGPRTAIGISRSQQYP